MSNKILSGLIALSLLGALSCNRPTEVRTVVELDVFSGRPNPRWELDGAASQRLRQLQGDLTSGGPALEPAGLGYRGFVYGDGRGQVRAYRGYVTTPRGVLADPSHSIEQFLLNELPAEYAAIRETILAEIR
ncbi:MAG TPA: hypothetical protein VJ717_02695 [Gemmatimonadaceae bacterium]|nr:hypothetical protein [Gemmatimonadaceae bacterium]